MINYIKRLVTKHLEPQQEFVDVSFTNIQLQFLTLGFFCYVWDLDPSSKTLVALGGAIAGSEIEKHGSWLAVSRWVLLGNDRALADWSQRVYSLLDSAIPCSNSCLPYICVWLSSSMSFVMLHCIGNSWLCTVTGTTTTTKKSQCELTNSCTVVRFWDKESDFWSLGPVVSYFHYIFEQYL